MMNIVYNFLIFGFPVYLGVAQYGLSTLAGEDASLFMGPTLAAAGLSFLISGLKPKKLLLDKETLNQLSAQNIIFRDPYDEKIRGLIIVSIFISIFLWAFSCGLSMKMPSEEWLYMPYHFLIGLLNYTIGVILYSLKMRE